MKIYGTLGWEPTGNVAVKVSSGEPPASDYLRRELIKNVVEAVEGQLRFGGQRNEAVYTRQRIY